jgi:hypothetical protein
MIWIWLSSEFFPYGSDWAARVSPQTGMTGAHEPLFWALMRVVEWLEV